MVRPPSGPPFRFTANEVQEMENVMENIKGGVPSRDVLRKLACQFSESKERHGKIVVQVKQVWNWFQNRRYAKKVKGHKVAPDSSSVEGSAAKRAVPSSVEDSETKRAGSNSSAAPSGRSSEAAEMEFEAKSARDGAWYDVASFITHRMFDSNEPEVQVRFSGFGAEEDEWVNVRKCVRQRSLPCEPSECIAVLPGDLILCFQEGKQQALYFDAHVLDAQRRRHDVRGCRCRFLVRYVHDQCEEVVPLRKICRRPESELRLQSLKALKDPSSVALDPKDHGKESDLKSGDGCSKESQPLQESTKINLQVLTATSQNTSL